jgi:hypothetical protein
MLRHLPGLTLVVACGSQTPPTPPTPRVTPSGAVIASNMLRRDYAGSKPCAECHD